MLNPDSSVVTLDYQEDRIGQLRELVKELIGEGDFIDPLLVVLVRYWKVVVSMYMDVEHSYIE